MRTSSCWIPVTRPFQPCRSQAEVRPRGRVWRGRGGGGPRSFWGPAGGVSLTQPEKALSRDEPPPLMVP